MADINGDRIALVTGAGRGMGRATALALSARGAKVMGVSLEEEDLASLARQAPIEVLVDSIGDADGCARIIAETRERLGHIDILANVAGVDLTSARPIWEKEGQDGTEWRKTFAVNLDGAYELTRLATKEMVDQGWGRVVMVSSTAGEVGGPMQTAYCASKHAMLGLMRSVAQDVAPFGITCNAVMPGQVRTPSTEHDTEQHAAKLGVSAEELWAKWAEQNPAKRMLLADEVANAIAFLADEAASGINGEAIRVTLGAVW